MDRRLAKRHKRQVSRAKSKVRLSEPDVRTQEQIEAARQVSRPAGIDGRKYQGSQLPRSFRDNLTTATGNAAKDDDQG
jgi:hypothetical protein